ncbi:hypothetical protein RHGRI_018406 [Rhododendron griersonianum]|uniref:RNase H type-1 domain-containing protein n=1 Tax=Rhododendron griersonianum TaxID=479676 RepID=A0AAV6K1H7_9ERIC|nr:hypothetical protein RHGRI_018406 [Rhododendron griersonianum]
MELCRVLEVCHVRREANKCADGLVKQAFDLCNEVYVPLIEPPMFMLQQLADDASYRG